nr:het domain-containing protein [Colletotrichum truncatum]KAF6788079.1 het domain-containing protein [Colletotrichum truncatum]
MPDSRSIRVFTLYPGVPSDPLRGGLEFVNIDSGAGAYETISYVWGDPSKTHGMVCDGVEVLITKSLHGALTCLRLPHASRRLWADQICIDQENTEEKSSQIPLMNVIYRNAKHVLVWLGHDEQKVARAAFDLVSDLAATFADRERRAAFDRRQAENSASCNDSHDMWSPLRALTSLSWFTRAWIVQEIGTRAPATLFWGDVYIEWEVLHSVCKDLTDYHHLRKEVDIQTPKVKYMYRRFIEPDRSSRHANRFSFLYELHRARHLMASDPRDRVYAMLGHYSIRNTPNQEIRALKPDYSKTLEEVYNDVATRGLIGDDKSLLTLASVQHKTVPSKQHALELSSLDYSSVSPNKLPSWVPDWRTYQSHILSEPTSPHRASGALRSSLQVDGSSKTIYIKGVIVDTIAAHSKSFQPREFHVNGSEYSNVIEKIWREVCEESDFDLASRYLPTARSAVFAYLQTLSNACVAVAWQDNQPYESASKDMWLAHGAAYLVRAAGKSCAISESLRDLAKAGDAAKWARAANGASRNRVFAKTKDGYYVLGPKTMEPGDIVCVLLGGKMPFCLRPWGNKYLLLGECYVHGIMNGQAVDGSRGEEMTRTVFEIV